MRAWAASTATPSKGKEAQITVKLEMAFQRVQIRHQCLLRTLHQPSAASSTCRPPSCFHDPTGSYFEKRTGSEPTQFFATELLYCQAEDEARASLKV